MIRSMGTIHATTTPIKNHFMSIRRTLNSSGSHSSSCTPPDNVNRRKKP